MLQHHAAEALTAPLAPTQSLRCVGGKATPPVAPPSTTPPAGPVVSLGHCSNDDPAHFGTLDGGQQWSLEGGALATEDALRLRWCLSADSDTEGGANVEESTITPRLIVCASGREAQRWGYDSVSRRIELAVQRPCPPKGSSRCKYCLESDSRGGSTALQLAVCGEATAQMWDVNGRTAAGGVVAAASGLCLTAVPPSVTQGPQLHEYGSRVSLLNSQPGRDRVHSAPRPVLRIARLPLQPDRALPTLFHRPCAWCYKLYRRVSRPTVRRGCLTRTACLASGVALDVHEYMGVSTGTCCCLTRWCLSTLGRVHSSTTPLSCHLEPQPGHPPPPHAARGVP